MRAFILLATIAVAYASNAATYAYHGLYAGSCAQNGLYYQDYYSYVMCAEGVPVVQKCADGTKSKEEGDYVYGNYYSLGAFCGINILAASYNPVVNTYHAPLNTYIAPVPSKHAAVPSYHAPVPTYHAPLPVHPAPVAKAIEGAEAVETEVEKGFSRDGLFKGYGQQAGKFVFRGKYADDCSNDGLYYRDYQSYVICSNNNAYVQPCAPGTRNSAYERFAYGSYYGYADFCDVNLTDFGYAGKRSAAGAARRAAYGYGAYGYGGAYGIPYVYGGVW